MTSTFLPDKRAGRGAGAPPPAADRRPPGRTRRRALHWLTAAGFQLPALVLFMGLVLLPMLFALYAAFFRWGGFGMPSDYIGGENFTRLLQDDVFLGDLWRCLVLVVLSLALQLPFALAMAVLLNQRMRGRAVYRMLFFAPYVLSEAITGILFGMIFAPDDGFADQVLGKVGLEGLGGEWFADPSTVMATVFLVMTWKYFGFHMMLYLAGLQAVPRELTEAALIDGASAWQRFRNVTLPLLAPTLRISVFLAVIGSIQLFDLVWVTTAGGPDHHSETMAVTMFQYGFKRYQVGYASAISVVMFGISLVFALAYQRFVLRRDLEGATTTMRGDGK
ncbi:MULTISPECIES: carbohydrate ABC transporter permease [Streptomyces]|uniref:Raffinose/stachyose/melibiose transport system permease protein n=2 Tax=Streptomyces TaxID=1883 RepID=A0AA89PV31_STRCU|nr:MULTISPECIES: sugar ABC transporter permease [Streptomyces]MBB5809602.1 raffinose/stachyose/melibiose transport system permease protein [Streptomyces collinus]MEC7052563.1 sugar ABC transporter permease [Streptomyces violaceochromogenes]WMX62934.1 sugar ABC transporter permease [Streptomyces collinus]GHC79319.1 sugar ABC transporter permease [Streptomyces violaceochromogenes]